MQVLLQSPFLLFALHGNYTYMALRGRVYTRANKRLAVLSDDNWRSLLLRDTNKEPSPRGVASLPLRVTSNLLASYKHATINQNIQFRKLIILKII